MPPEEDAEVQARKLKKMMRSIYFVIYARMGSGLWRTIFQKLSTGLEEIPAPDDLSGHFDQSYQTEFSRAG